MLYIRSTVFTNDICIETQFKDVMYRVLKNQQSQNAMIVNFVGEVLILNFAIVIWNAHFDFIYNNNLLSYILC